MDGTKIPSWADKGIRKVEPVDYDSLDDWEIEE